MCCSSGSWSLVSRRPICDSLSFATVHLNLQLIACPVHRAPIFPLQGQGPSVASRASYCEAPSQCVSLRANSAAWKVSARDLFEAFQIQIKGL